MPLEDVGHVVAGQKSAPAAAEWIAGRFAGAASEKCAACNARTEMGINAVSAGMSRSWATRITKVTSRAMQVLARGLFVGGRRRGILGSRNLVREGFTQLFFFFFLLLGKVSLALRELVVGFGQLAVLCVMVLGRWQGEYAISRGGGQRSRRSLRSGDPRPASSLSGPGLPSVASILDANARL